MRNFLPSKISTYFGWSYIKSFMGLSAIILGVVYLFDTVELLRRAEKFDDVSLLLVMQMGLLKLPEVGQLILPFAVLFSGIFCLWQLTRRSELVAARAAGLSIWQILAPIILGALMVGVLQICIVNPFGSLLLSRFESLEKTHLVRQTSLVSFSGKGLWLKQDFNEGHLILHAANIDMNKGSLNQVIVWFFDGGNNFYRRLDADDARLNKGEWIFNQVVSNEPQKLPDSSDFIALATDLTLDDIADSFASPQTISFWKLPASISTMESAGFDASPLKMHFQVLLAQPFLYVAMILLAASVSLHSPRAGRTFMLIASGVFIGFLIFFLSSFLQALGISGQIPIVLAAWSPALISLLLGVSVMMSLEDG